MTYNEKDLEAGKACTKCAKVKPLAEYGKSTAARDGLAYNCKVCRKAYRQENNGLIADYNRGYRLGNKELIAERSRSYQIENKELIAEYMRGYRLANKDKLIEYRRSYQISNKEWLAEKKLAYRQANRELLAERSRSYQIANKELIAERRAAHPENSAKHRHKRRALKAGNGVFLVSTKELKRIKSSPCVHCGAPGPSQIDHVVPIAKGGTHGIGNLMPLCQRCNGSKGANLYIVFKRRVVS